MTRVSLDSNVLVYAELEPESDKGKRAHELIAASAPREILAVQTLLEFAAVVRRRRPDSVESALKKISIWGSVFETAATTDRVVAEALKMVLLHQFQVWDGVIWAAARQAGAAILFSEDLHNGFAKDGMRAVDPFSIDATALQILMGA